MNRHKKEHLKNSNKDFVLHEKYLFPLHESIVSMHKNKINCSKNVTIKRCKWLFDTSSNLYYLITVTCTRTAIYMFQHIYTQKDGNNKKLNGFKLIYPIKNDPCRYKRVTKVEINTFLMFLFEWIQCRLLFLASFSRFFLYKANFNFYLSQ